ncbi:NAD dependent epimerase/dehydratase [Aspergillus floccosus]
MASQHPTLPKGSRVLVTGANGFIASNVIDHLLSNGYIVRGTVRDPKPYLDDIFHKEYPEESLNSDALIRALDGVSGIIHAQAADMSFSSDPNAVIPWVVNATMKILAAAAQTSSVKRVVLVSSSSAAYLTLPGEDPFVVDMGSYNDKSVKLASDETTPNPVKGFAVYAASKTEAERKAWTWMEEYKPQMLHIEKPSSMIVPYKLLRGEDAYTFMIEQWAVDVEDIARLCCICLMDPSVKSERIFAVAERLNPADMALILWDIKPDKSVPRAPKTQLPRVDIRPRERADKLLRESGRQGFSSMREAIGRGVKSFEHLQW